MTEQMRLIFIYYINKMFIIMKSFDNLTGDQELEVHTATYGREIDQSHHAKSISHINYRINSCSLKLIFIIVRLIELFSQTN